MIQVIRYRNARQLISNPNLCFKRHYPDKNEKIKDPKTVASQILQNNHSQLSNKHHYPDKNEKIEDPKTVASHILQNNHSQLSSEEKILPGDPVAVAQQIITEFPEEPTTCCMSGCANCVWLDYAEKLSAYYKDGGDRAEKEINEKVDDSNIRAFLLHELRTARNAKQ